jgi:hypothetical protein
LKSALNPSARTLDVQTYVWEGKEYIPVFSSAENLRASTNVGGAIEKQKIAIRRTLLLSVIRDEDLFCLDPHLVGELWFTGAVLKRSFASTADK